MVEKIILGGIGLLIACCFFAAIEEEVKQWRKRKPEIDAKREEE